MYVIIVFIKKGGRYGATIQSNIDKRRAERFGGDFNQGEKGGPHCITYARALLLLDAGEHGQKWLVAQVAEALGTTSRSLEHLKKRFVEEGISAAINRKKRVTPPREIQFGGEFEAKLLALACSEAPEGRNRWTVRLLADKMVELKMVPRVSPMTICNTLKKMKLSLT